MAAPNAAPATPIIIPETPAHDLAIETVLDRAFGPGRFAKPSEKVRAFARHDLALSRVGLLERRVIACCRIYDVSISGKPVLFLGPLAVDPDEQHHGLGHRLVRETLAACAESDAEAVVLMGDPKFFTTLGFTEIPKGRVQMPVPAEPRRLHWIALRENALDDLSGPLSPPLAASRA